MAPRRVLRRPAAEVDGRKDPPRERLLRDLSVAELSKLKYIWLKGALYYHRAVEVVVKLQGVKFYEGQVTLEVEASGTKDEALLRLLAGKEKRTMSVHVCPIDCGGQVTGEVFIHGTKFEEVEKEELPWFTNLLNVDRIRAEREDEDEMVELRQEAEERQNEREMGGAESPKEKKKKKKEKVKKDKKEKEGDERAAEKKRRLSSESEEMEPGQKGLAAVFGGTGLDPRPKERRKILKRARKLGRKKKKKKQSSGDTSSSSSSGSSRSSRSADASAGLFNSEKRMKVIWRRFPGALAATAIEEARGSLLSSSGMLWDVDRRQLPPIATHYTRQQMAPAMSPPPAARGIDGQCGPGWTSTRSHCLSLRCVGPATEEPRSPLQGHPLVSVQAA